MKKFLRNDRLSLPRIKKDKEKWRDAPIKTKILRAFYTISIVGCISGLLGLIFLHTTSNEYNKALVNYGIAQGDIGKLGIEIEKTNSSLRDFLFLKEDDRDQAKKELNEQLDNIEIYLDTVETYMSDEEEIQTLKDIRIDLARYKQVRNEVASSIIGNRQDNGLMIFRQDGAPLMNEISEKITALLQSKINQCEYLTKKLNMLKNINSIFVIVSIVGTFIISVIVAGKLSERLSKNISKIKDCVEEMAKGNLNITIGIDCKDEVGMLAQSFSEMVDRLKTYINEISYVLGNISDGNFAVSTKENYQGSFVEIKKSLENIISSLSEVFMNIKESSGIVNSNSEQLSNTAQVLSSRSGEQAESVDKLTNYINMINEKVKTNAKNADSTNKITSDLLKEIEESNTKMKDMLSAMDNIESASKDIENIISSINEIASQTDLLALNAAIEAARAGEVGKGFAVVADEVRSLSAQSADAVNQSNSLIKNCIDAVNNGKDLANSTDQSLRKLIENVEKVTDLVSRINTASSEQAESINKLHSDIVKISSAIQENSEAAQESAAASEELNSQSELLNGMIDKFKIEK